MQEVRWDNGDTEQAEEHNFFRGKGTKILNEVQD
jgi:hypothetical protein